MLLHIHKLVFHNCMVVNVIICTLLFYRDQDDESSSEFSFTSSLMEALDGQGKKVHFVGVSKY